MSVVAATDFTGTSAGEKQKRELLMLYVNVADFGSTYSYAATSSTASWELEGAGVEDASHTYEFEEETKNDILGHSVTDVTALNESMDMDMDIQKGNKLQFQLIKFLEGNDWTKFSKFEVLKVRKYLDDVDGSTDHYHAELHKDCTIRPSSEGGSGVVGFPISIKFSGDKVLGTVTINASTGAPTFTAAS